MWPALIVFELVSIVAANDFAFVAPSVQQTSDVNAFGPRISPVGPEGTNGFPKQAMWVIHALILSSTSLNRQKSV